MEVVAREPSLPKERRSVGAGVVNGVVNGAKQLNETKPLNNAKPLNNTNPLSNTNTLIHRSIPTINEFYFIDYASIYFQREKARFFRHSSLEAMISYSPHIPLRTLHFIDRNTVTDVLEMERWILSVLGESSHHPQAGHLTEEDCSLLESLLYKLYSLRDTVDEVYCYLIKMITDNPSPVSELKGFEVLFLLARCILPSNNFFNYCLRFCYNSVQNRDDVGLLSFPYL